MIILSLLVLIILILLLPTSKKKNITKFSYYGLLIIFCISIIFNIIHILYPDISFIFSKIKYLGLSEEDKLASYITSLTLLSLLLSIPRDNKFSERIYNVCSILLVAITVLSYYINNIFIFCLLFDFVFLMFIIIYSLSQHEDFHIKNIFVINIILSIIIFILISQILIIKGDFYWGNILSMKLLEINFLQNVEYNRFIKLLFLSVLFKFFIISLLFVMVTSYKIFYSSIKLMFTGTIVIMCLYSCINYLFGNLSRITYGYKQELMIMGVLISLFSIISVLFKKRLNDTIAYYNLVYIGYIFIGYSSFTNIGFSGSILNTFTYIVSVFIILISNSEIKEGSSKKSPILSLLILLTLINFPFMGNFTPLVMIIRGIFEVNWIVGNISIIGFIFLSIYVIKYYESINRYSNYKEVIVLLFIIFSLPFFVINV